MQRREFNLPKSTSKYGNCMPVSRAHPEINYRSVQHQELSKYLLENPILVKTWKAEQRSVQKEYPFVHDDPDVIWTMHKTAVESSRCFVTTRSLKNKRIVWRNHSLVHSVSSNWILPFNFFIHYSIITRLSLSISNLKRQNYPVKHPFQQNK